jgi:hypothetical protein
MKSKPKKTGPEPEAVRSEGSWKNAIKAALSKKKPPEGWPKAKGEKF